MNIQTEVFGDVLVVHTPEEFSEETADTVRQCIEGTGHTRVVADLDDTESIDSHGLTMLLNLHELLQTRGGDFKIATANAVNRKILEITRLDRELEVFSGLVEAVKSFRANP